jgi:hypothetical protein
LINSTPPPRGGHFSVSIVCLVRELIVQTGGSFRTVAALLAVIVRRWHLQVRTPSFSTIRWWILRLGCYALRCPLPKDRPWVWLVDHTIQIGAAKLLAIVGCPLADVPFGKRDLCLADLRLIALVPMTHSTHELVAIELEKALERTGIPRLIVSDQGSDVKKGIERFQRRHPDVVWVYDIAHYGANVLENRWERDPRWQEMLRQLSCANQKMRQTAQAYLLAPTLRPKARFMNVAVLLRFLSRVLRLLEGETPNQRAVEQYGWLLGYREALAGWLEEQRLVQTTIERVRRHGVNAKTLAELERSWGQLSNRTGTAMVAGYMRVYARQYGGLAGEGEVLVGSSEVLESSFGKLKRLEGDASQASFTAMVLALGAILGQPGEADVRQALEAVPKKAVTSWLRQNLGLSTHVLRRRLFARQKT